MLAPILIVGAVLLAGYGLLVRPRALDWASTPEERLASLPGDDLVPDATTVTTRAVTIRAPVSAVWPWLVQMGQDRRRFLHPQLGGAAAPVRHP